MHARSISQPCWVRSPPQEPRWGQEKAQLSPQGVPHSSLKTQLETNPHQSVWGVGWGAHSRDCPGGPVVRTPGLPLQGAQVPSQVRELRSRQCGQKIIILKNKSKKREGLSRVTPPAPSPLPSLSLSLSLSIETKRELKKQKTHGAGNNDVAPHWESQIQQISLSLRRILGPLHLGDST